MAWSREEALPDTESLVGDDLVGDDEGFGSGNVLAGVDEVAVLSSLTWEIRTKDGAYRTRYTKYPSKIGMIPSERSARLHLVIKKRPLRRHREATVERRGSSSRL